MKTYIIIDLEWNQCPYGKESSVPGLPFEIIEVGAVKLNERFYKIGEFQSLVKPVAYKSIHYRVKRVIDIKMKVLKKKGRPFADVMKDFFEWAFAKGEEPFFCSWGPLDLYELQRNMDYHEVDNPFPFPFLYYDVQKLYSLDKGLGMSEKQPLDKVVEDLGIPKDMPFHHAFSDAYYTGRIMKKIKFSSVSKYYSMDYYRLPSEKNEEVVMDFSDYIKYVTRPFHSKEEIFEEEDMKSVTCSECGKKLRKKIRWFSSNSKTFYCLCLCRKHGYVRGKIQIKSLGDGRVYAIKIVKRVDDISAKDVEERKKVTSLKKRRKKMRERRLKTGINERPF